MHERIENAVGTTGWPRAAWSFLGWRYDLVVLVDSRRVLGMGAITTGQMVRRVNQEVVVLLGWGRAILLQLAHPLVAAAVADHGDYWSGPLPYLRRTRRTVGSMLNLTFGSPSEVQATADRINSIHERVHGRLQAGTPRFPPGTFYTATDPELLAWVHVTLIDSQLQAYEAFVEPLGLAEKDQYCSESAEFASLLKVPRDLLQTRYCELTGQLHRFYEDPVHISDTALKLSHDLLYPPGGIIASSLLGLGRLATAGLLPESLRRAYDLPWDETRERRFVAVAGVIRRVRRVTPQFLRVWAPARRCQRVSPPGRCPMA